MKSLERTIINRIVWTLLVIGVVAIAAAYQLARDEANEFMDDDLRQFAETTDTSKPGRLTEKGLQEPEDYFERIVWKDGTKLAATPNAPSFLIEPTAFGFSNLRQNGENWRVYSSARDGVTITLAQRISAREELAQHAALEISLVIVATIIVTWLTVHWTVSRTMRRLNLLSGEIAERGIDANDPLPTENVPIEYRPIVGAMNALNQTLRGALEQQRRFIADSAHELRTPLTALRIQIDNLADAVSADAADEARALQSGIDRASTVLNQLLRLARFDGRDVSAEIEEVDVGEVLTQCVADAVAIAGASKIDIGLTDVKRLRAKIAHADLHLLLANIIDNAVLYTPSGGAIDCAIARYNGDGRICICDTGPGVPAELLSRLTERFFRAASPDIPGSGLGLAIAKAIADSYGLTLECANRQDRSGLVVSITIPENLIASNEISELAVDRY